MRQFSARVRQKARWWGKVFDADIASKWREEIAEHNRELVLDKLWGGEEVQPWRRGEEKAPGLHHGGSTRIHLRRARVPRQ